ncbi:hypothetical protein [Amycolatopsis sp. cmx-11-51]|uniref:hypothetical protein n=1 Tax=unclassified Amycolatopsis TaxID=2618356 RepID=UPI0039E6CBE0
MKVPFIAFRVAYLRFLLTAAGPDVVTLTAAALLAGFAEGPQLSALFAIRHREAPAEVRAQVFATAASVKITDSRRVPRPRDC